jgi:putative transposase
VKKSLSTRTHACECGTVLDRDENAAKNILQIGISTVGDTGTWILDPNDWGEGTATHVGEILSEQVPSGNQESPCMKTGECQISSIRAVSPGECGILGSSGVM